MWAMVVSDFAVKALTSFAFLVCINFDGLAFLFGGTQIPKGCGEQYWGSAVKLTVQKATVHLLRRPSPVSVS